MLSIQNELTLQNELQNFMTINVFWKKVKAQQQQQQNKHKFFATAENRAWDLSHRSLTRFRYTNETNERIHWSQAI